MICDKDKEPMDDDEVPLENSISVSYKEIPILCLDVPVQLWIGGLIGNLAIEFFRRYSSLSYGLGRSLNPFGVYKQGAELPANGDLNELQADPNRRSNAMVDMVNKGFVGIGSGDDIEMVEIHEHTFKIADDHLTGVVDAMHQIVAQMANSASANASMTSRSGLSKKMDHYSKEIVLSAYASIVKEFAIKLYDLVSLLRQDNIVWNAQGMDSYKVIDRDILLQEATTMNMIYIPSKTFKIA